MYNLTGLYNAGTPVDVVTFANNTTGGTLLGLFVVVIFFVMLFALKRYDFDDALLVSGWTCFMLSAILTYGKFINIIFPLGFLCIAGFSSLYIWLTKNY